MVVSILLFGSERVPSERGVGRVKIGRARQSEIGRERLGERDGAREMGRERRGETSERGRDGTRQDSPSVQKIIPLIQNSPGGGEVDSLSARLSCQYRNRVTLYKILPASAEIDFLSARFSWQCINSFS